jgi:hypothetical protein
MFKLKFWQKSSNKTSLLIEQFLICGAEKVWIKTKNEVFVESSE